MIEGLISGQLVGIAETREGKHETTYVTARVKTDVAGGEHVMVNVIAFSSANCDALLALDDGDALTLAGTLTPKVWTDKQGNTKPVMDMVATNVLTVYHVNRKRAAVVIDTN
jgi:hypothetical protein